MRNGMSVKEIYEALDQFERLKSAFDKERTEHSKLKLAVNKAACEMLDTALTYTVVAANVDERDAISKLEFSSKRSGLLEAYAILKKFTNPKRGDTACP